MLLFNKSIQPLNQFAKNIKESSCFCGYCWRYFYHFLTKYFLHFFFLLRTTSFESQPYAKYQKKKQAFLDLTNRNSNSIYKEKFIMYGRDITIILILHNNAQDY